MFDANTVVSAALSPFGTSRLALMAARHHGAIALSQAVFTEIVEVLSRPKLSYALNKGRREGIIELLSSAAMWIEPVSAINDCRDAKDNKYLELAAAAAARFIVSGDADLLVLNPWRSVRILNAADFLAAVAQP